MAPKKEHKSGEQVLKEMEEEAERVRKDLAAGKVRLAYGQKEMVTLPTEASDGTVGKKRSCKAAEGEAEFKEEEEGVVAGGEEKPKSKKGSGRTKKAKVEVDDEADV